MILEIGVIRDEKVVKFYSGKRKKRDRVDIF
jgi:hypothetical protein